MELVIRPETQEFIDQCVKSGEFATAGEVVDLVVQKFTSSKTFGNFAPGELDQLLEEAEKGGPAISFEEYQTAFKTMREKFIAGKK